MARLVLIAFGFAIAASPAWSQSSPNSAAASHRYALPDSANYAREAGRMWASRELAPNALFGLGMFGLKTDRSNGSPVTVREVDTPRTRRAGVGFSLKF